MMALSTIDMCSDDDDEISQIASLIGSWLETTPLPPISLISLF